MVDTRIYLGQVHEDDDDSSYIQVYRYPDAAMIFLKAWHWGDRAEVGLTAFSAELLRDILNDWLAEYGKADQS